jgi:hypothetical protein
MSGRVTWLALALVVALTATAAAQYTASAYESLTVAASAVGCVTSDSAIKRAVITTETAEIRFRYDGTDPTSSEGHLAPAGTTIVVTGWTNISRFRAIRTTATSATLKWTFEK